LACRRADGTQLWVLASSGPVAVEGEPDALLATFHDVTERHQVQARHAGQAAGLALLAELPEKNPGPVCRLTPDGTILMANAATRRFLGVDDPRGGNWLDWCPGMTGEIWQRVLASDQRITHEAERERTWILFTHVRSDAGDLVFA